MGTRFRVVLYAAGPAEANRGAKAAFEVAARLDSLFSDYRPDSEVSRLSRAGGDAVPVSTELWALLDVARSWSERTAGAFDVTVGPLTRLWRWSARRGELPDAERLERARAAVGYQRLVMDSARHTVALPGPGSALDLGGIAKGFAADRMLAELAARGITAALVDVGGDLALGDPPPGKDGWRVAIPDGGVLTLARAAVATSGDRYRYVEIDGRRHAHVVDPRTGLGVVDAPTVVVVASDATTADALASALGVLPREVGRDLAASLAPIAARVAGAGDGGGDRVWESETFMKLRERQGEGFGR